MEGGDSMSVRMNKKLGTIVIDSNVIATYAGSVAVECFGIVGMASVSMKDGLVKLLGRENLGHGISVRLNGNRIALDFHVIISYGVSISAVAENLVSSVQYKLEAFTGMEIEKITKELDEQVGKIFDSENYKKYLKTMSKFHNYSFNNTLLIALQRPDASLVAGFNAWKNNFHRNVKRGEKGIKILAPAPVKKETEVEMLDPITNKKVLDEHGNPKMETVQVIQDCFNDEVQEAATSRGLQRRHLIHQAVRKDVHQMHQVLNEKQFGTYMMLLGATLKNKGL